MGSTVRVCKGDDVVVSSGEKVHITCQKQYINPKDIGGKKKKVELPKGSARVASSPFNSQMDCLFCGTMVTQRGASFSCVKTDAFVQTILECCDSCPDEWAFTMRGRIEYYGCDLHATDWVHHCSCSGDFQSGLNIPLQFKNVPEAKRRKSGRPKNED